VPKTTKPMGKNASALWKLTVPLAFAALFASGSVGFWRAVRMGEMLPGALLMTFFYAASNPLVWLGVWAAKRRINRYQCPHCAAWIARGKEVAAGELAECSDCKQSCIKPPAC
jgi:hypothetical protein